MAFVHSLVRERKNGKKGWCAPAELGESASHYVSFVIPVPDNRHYFDKYICETITVIKGERLLKSSELDKEGSDSFSLRVGSNEFRFIVHPGPKTERCLPYIGKLGHDDFQYKFVEIEPEDPQLLDELFDNDCIYVIGCEPFTHYAGITKSVSTT